MKSLKLTLIVLSLLTSSLAIGQSKTVHPNKSDLKWTGKAAFNSYALTGSLNFKNGVVTIKNDSLLALEMKVDMTSLDHENNTLKSHLRSEDFFEVLTYEEATLKLLKPTVISNGETTIQGYLTIKDTTKLETFKLTFNEEYTQLYFEISIDRTAYGVTFNSPSFYEKLKEDAIADTFQLKGRIQLH
jgi:polyisoprenoid-binding protein YceI